MWFSLLLATAFFAHDFHVSIAQADYKAGEIQMTLRVFTDDLEMTLEERGAKNLRLGTPQEFAEADALIAAYLKERVRFELGDQSLPMTFVGKEVEYDLCYLYLSFKWHRRKKILESLKLLYCSGRRNPDLIQTH